MSQPVQRLRGHAGGVLLLAYKHDNKTLATGGFGGTMLLRGPGTGKVRATLGDHQVRASAVGYSMNAITLVTEVTRFCAFAICKAHFSSHAKRIGTRSPPYGSPLIVSNYSSLAESETNRFVAVNYMLGT